ncbi:glycosyl hydrolase family 28 protein [Coraliomargarita sp. SDUM461003]|uniref:Glycosyl hydrolase family 28 protein n=1 Tax=Thalassobacterium maritimum TaxID=3041265 RepID=A0ABU1AQ55_9BACT|nr:glycosyl hydrolase family 28 protein [Coraliomargarita sp. SDUM461003]MDQ8206309.1 glycosyl hydrolase family 28 protein [Coraliomargarita sp. SDUM461003]
MSIYNIEDFNAVADGQTVNTVHIQAAVDAAYQAGGGTVRVPTGQFVTGTIHLKENVCIELAHGSTILGSTNIADYPQVDLPEYKSQKATGPQCALFYAEKADNIALTGTGTIDGRGDSFPTQGTDLEMRPRNIQFVSCNRVKVSGLTLRNSGMWMQHYNNCEDVLIENLNVYNHANANNDMIDIDSCRRVVVNNITGDTDDDGITIKSTGPAPCKDVAITNCVVHAHCNAIKIGTETTAHFENITLSNITISRSRNEKVHFGLENGISGISLEMVDGGVIDGITMDNINMDGVEVPIFIRIGARGRPYYTGIPRPGIGQIKRVSLSNIMIRNAGITGSSITGQPGFPIEDIYMSNIRFFTQGGVTEMPERHVDDMPLEYPEGTMFGTLPAAGMYIKHAKDIYMNGITVSADADDVRPAFYVESVDTLRINELNLKRVAQAVMECEACNSNKSVHEI